MPAGCLVQRCVQCDWHIVRDNKLECNYQNRLRLAKGGLGAFAGLSEKDVLERKRAAAMEEAERMKKLLEAATG